MTPNPPAVSAKVRFPITDVLLEFDLQPALLKLTGPKVRELLEGASSNELLTEPDIVYDLLRSAEDAAVSDAFVEYAERYYELNDRLTDHRGYGLEGDEEPELSVDIPELLAWVEVHKPDVATAVMVECFSYDIRVERGAGGWRWTVRDVPNASFAAHASQSSVKPFRSKRQVLADAAQALDVRNRWLHNASL